MRYQSRVTDIPSASALTELSATERRLWAALSRPRRIALLCIVALSGLGWTALGLMSADAQLWLALCRPTGSGGLTEFGLLLAMWAAMALAMMLPTAGPMILTYAEIADTALRKGEPVVSPLVLATGYLTVWLGCAVAAAALQVVLAQVRVLDAGPAGTAAAGALLIGAGLYQFSALKHACLTMCQRPFPFFFANWTAESPAVFKLGLRQGLFCLGCCWAMMLVMFAAGTMNAVWMALLGIVMTIEKLSNTARFAHAVGAALMTIGLGVLAMGAMQ